MDLPIIVWVYAVILGSALIWRFVICRKRAYVDKYQYLEVMSYTEWRDGRNIRRELEEKYGGWIPVAEFYTNMRYLHEEGLVEYRDEMENFELEDGSLIPLRKREYRKRPGGRKQKEDRDELVPRGKFAPAPL